MHVEKSLPLPYAAFGLLWVHRCAAGTLKGACEFIGICEYAL